MAIVEPLDKNDCNATMISGHTALHTYFRFMAAIFDLPLIPMSDSVHTSFTELQDPENVDAAFGISLLSSIEAETLV